MSGLFGSTRVPLIAPVWVVFYRLDIQATWAEDPPGDKDSGYDELFREPVISRTAGARHVPRVETGPVYVKAQMETSTYEELQLALGGDNKATDQTYVLHRQDLAAAGLLDSNNECVFKPGDRIDHIEEPLGTTVLTYSKPLYVYRVLPGSQGFGPTGYDLNLVYTTHRSTDPRQP